MREGSGGETTVDHGWDMPDGARESLEQILQEAAVENKEDECNGVNAEGPFVSKSLGMYNGGWSHRFTYQENAKMISARRFALPSRP